MSKEPDNLEKDEAPEVETFPIEQVVEPIDESIESLIPSMNVNLPAKTEEGPPEEEMITDEALLTLYGDIMTNIRNDRQEVSDYVANMAEMVFNEGDATTSSKEALVNFVKIKSDLSDKAVKIADLMTRIKLKARDTFPRYLAANQNNIINIGDSGQKRQLLEAINKAKGGK
jgi:hypothetical protein